MDGFLERGGIKMIFYDYTTPKMIVEEQGKHIRSKNDVYVSEHINEDGTLVPEHIPYYSTTIFVPDTNLWKSLIKDIQELKLLFTNYKLIHSNQLGDKYIIGSNLIVEKLKEKIF